MRLITILLLALLAVLFAIGGKFLLTLPLTLASLALVKLKGLSLIQLLSLYRLIQTLRRSGRFSFNKSNSNNLSSISVSEAYELEKAGHLGGTLELIESKSISGVSSTEYVFPSIRTLT